MSDGTDQPAQEIKIGPQPGPQTEFLSTLADIALYGGAAGGGKLLPLDEVVPTPGGWKTMGELKRGDLLFDEKGEVCRVLVAHQVEPSPELWRFTFDDGTTIESCIDHKWHTFTAKDLAALTRKDEAWREKRRAKRVSRAKAETSKSAKFMAALLKRNQTIRNVTRPPNGAVRTTREIVESLYVGCRANHAIAVPNAIVTKRKSFDIDPYLLGLWLGDGTAVTGVITWADKPAYSDWIVVPSAKYAYRVPGFTTKLRKAGLLGNKHVPPEYLRGSIDQRLALLQGLMDTDGTVTKGGGVEFDNTNEGLVDAVIELACSLGHKPGKKTSKIAKLNGKECARAYSVKWTPKDIVFRLERKASKQKLSTRRVTGFRYIIKAERINSRPGRCITVSSPSSLFLAGRRMVPTHNSFALLLEPLRHYKNPKFGAVIFRRNSTQVRNEGGLWDESANLYAPLGAHPREASLEWEFPSPDGSPLGGPRVKFAHLENENTKYNWQGSAAPFFGFDELTHFSESQFFYLMSRNRSMSGVPGYIRATCNPDVNSWVRKLIDWYIGEDGYPIPERSGVLRWFIRVEDALVWASSKEELVAMHGPEVMPKSFTFIPSKIQDNKILMEKDPSYIGYLLALPRVERLRLLGGNWNVRASAGMMFQREWFPILRTIPGGWTRCIRFWDRAATKPNTENKDPDWTRGLKMYKYPNDTWLVADLKSARDTPGAIQKLVCNVASHDGVTCKVMSQQDPGSAGVAEAESFIKALQGFNVSTVVINKDKINRAKPVSAQAEHHNIYVLEAPWNEDFFSEVESFPEGSHDDIVDVLSGAFNQLAGGASILDAL